METFTGKLLPGMLLKYINREIELYLLVCWAEGMMTEDHASNSLRGSSDCRIIVCKVPIRISAWLATGTVMVRLGNRSCMMMWLPRCRTSVNPCWDRIAHTALPERTSSLPNSNLNLRYKYFSMKSVLHLFSRRRFKE